MDNTIRVICKNSGREYIVPMGTTLKEFASAHPEETAGPTVGEEGILAAIVDNRLKEIDFALMESHQVRFVGYGHPDGRRTYVRTLCFVLQNAVSELFPDKVLIVDYSLPGGGLYCEIHDLERTEDGKPVVFPLTSDDLDAIRVKMRETVSRNLPIRKKKVTAEEAENIFTQKHQSEKVSLIKSLGRFTYSMYYLDGKADTFHGPLLSSTGGLRIFDLCTFNNGFCLQFPGEGEFRPLEKMGEQSKIADALKEHSTWCAMMGISGVGTLNKFVQSGRSVELVNLCEAFHERKYAEIADKIYQRRDKVKIVFIAGPSSSGKTSSSKRLALECKILGMNPKVIELDNYFVDREHTPKDENGNYDFESLYAMDLDFLGKQLNELLEGQEVELPTFNFKTGSRSFDGRKMRLEKKDILIMEGIHALNPAMIPSVDPSKVFRVYASALTSLSIDENNNISTSDNRMLRRMIRDNLTRGIVPEETILRWQSVRKGENRNIFPFQENADAIFNSAHLFELPVLKYYAEPLLRRISPSSAAYTEATRLLKFLDYIVAFSPAEISCIPPTSILREFIGGQTL